SCQREKTFGLCGNQSLPPQRWVRLVAAFVKTRACNPTTDLFVLLFGLLFGLPSSCLAEATKLPEGKDLRPLWQTELATPSFALVSLAEQCPACTVRALAVKRPE
ncbi:MAG: hypothetical protein M0Q19_10475, partial [Candidatus Cloacimonetes bacterium]|nr:hypothetical protein [Candidatus Cloacimonadota bacterium]